MKGWEKVMSTEKTEINAKTENSTKNEITAKKRDTRKRRRLSEKEEMISAIFIASEWALQMEDRELSEIHDYIFKMMALTKYGAFFTKPCVKFVVDKALSFSHSVKVKSGMK